MREQNIHHYSKTTACTYICGTKQHYNLYECVVCALYGPQSKPYSKNHCRTLNTVKIFHAEFLLNHVPFRSLAIAPSPRLVSQSPKYLWLASKYWINWMFMFFESFERGVRFRNGPQLVMAGGRKCASACTCPIGRTNREWICEYRSDVCRENGASDYRNIPLIVLR